MSIALDRELIKALDRVDQGAWSDRVLQSALKSLANPAHTSAFVARFRGVLEQRRDLDRRLKVRLKRWPKGYLIQALRLGLYDLDCAKAPHAVLNRLHKACGDLPGREHSLINAVLRGMLRAEETPRPEPAPASELIPGWLQKVLNKNPDKSSLEKKCAGLLKPRPSWFRFCCPRNQAKAQRQLLSDQLILTQIDPFTGSYVSFPEPPAAGLESLTVFKQKGVRAQDLSTVGALLLLEVSADAKVLDACAAPGGKSLALLDEFPELDLTLVEADPGRCRALERRVPERIKVLHADLRALASGDSPELHQVYDRILLDVPCGGSGSVGSRPEIALSDANPVRPALLELQQELLLSAARLLKAGGTLVYSTCSLDDRENAQQCRKFLESHLEFRVNNDGVPADYRSEEGAWQWLPWKQNLAGGAWAIALEKKA